MRPKTIKEESMNENLGGGMSSLLRGKTATDILDQFYAKMKTLKTEHITEGPTYDVYRLKNHNDVKHFMKHGISTTVFKNYFIILDKSAVEASGDQLLVIAVSKTKNADGKEEIKREVTNYKGQRKDEEYLDKF